MVLKNCFFLLIIIQITFAASPDSTVILTKNDLIEFKIGNYINSFKEFDNSLVVGDKMVSIGIYYDVTKQDEVDAQKLKKRFETQIPIILKKYAWANNYILTINIWGEKRE